MDPLAVQDSDRPSEEVGGNEPSTANRPSVNQLASKFSDANSEQGKGLGKRDRSESGDPAPAGKRGAVERNVTSESSPSQFNRRWKDYLENALDEMQQRITSFISREIHELNHDIQSKLSEMDKRIGELEQHVEERDSLLEELKSELRETRKEMSRLGDRAESAEMNSRLPCLILSGQAVAPRRARLSAPLPPTGQSAPRGVAADRASAGPPGAPGSRAEASGRGVAARGGRAPGERSETEGEDVHGLVIEAVTARLRGLNIREEDIDRAHRLPGPNNRIIVRFVRSGPNSIRDQLMSRRLELRHHNDLFINESLTAQKSLLYRSLLDAKKAKKVYTVFTRWGHVYFKEKQYGISTRVDCVDKLRELGFSVKE